MIILRFQIELSQVYFSASLTCLISYYVKSFVLKWAHNKKAVVQLGSKVGVSSFQPPTKNAISGGENLSFVKGFLNFCISTFCSRTWKLVTFSVSREAAFASLFRKPIFIVDCKYFLKDPVWKSSTWFLSSKEHIEVCGLSYTHRTPFQRRNGRVPNFLSSRILHRNSSSMFSPFRK